MLFPNFVFSFSLLSSVFAMPNKRSTSIEPICLSSVQSKAAEFDSQKNSLRKFTAEEESKFKREYLSVVLSYFINSYSERQALFNTYKEKLETGYFQDDSIQELFKKALFFFKNNGKQLLSNEKDKFLAPLVKFFEDQMVIATIKSNSAIADYAETNASSINSRSVQNIAEISASVADQLKISSQKIPTWFQIFLYAGSISGLIALSAIIAFSLTILRKKIYGSSITKPAEHDQVIDRLLNVNSNETFNICNESLSV
jgi:hypothetical protein